MIGTCIGPSYKSDNGFEKYHARKEDIFNFRYFPHCAHLQHWICDKKMLSLYRKCVKRESNKKKMVFTDILTEIVISLVI